MNRLLLIVIIFPSIAYAQLNLFIQINDSITHKPIELVNVFINEKIKAYSNENGIANVYTKENEVILTLTCIGYNSKKVKINNTDSNNLNKYINLALSPAINLFKEVTVSLNNDNEKWIGFLRKYNKKNNHLQSNFLYLKTFTSADNEPAEYCEIISSAETFKAGFKINKLFNGKYSLNNKISNGNYIVNYDIIKMQELYSIGNINGFFEISPIALNTYALYNYYIVNTFKNDNMEYTKFYFVLKETEKHKFEINGYATIDNNNELKHITFNISNHPSRFYASSIFDSTSNLNIQAVYNFDKNHLVNFKYEQNYSYFNHGSKKSINQKTIGYFFNEFKQNIMPCVALKIEDKYDYHLIDKIAIDTLLWENLPTNLTQNEKQFIDSIISINYKLNSNSLFFYQNFDNSFIHLNGLKLNKIKSGDSLDVIKNSIIIKKEDVVLAGVSPIVFYKLSCKGRTVSIKFYPKIDVEKSCIFNKKLEIGSLALDNWMKDFLYKINLIEITLNSKLKYSAQDLISEAEFKIASLINNIK